MTTDWIPVTTDDERLVLKENCQCPDCGGPYLNGHIPWRTGTCTDPSCNSYNKFEIRKCAICKSPRWMCSC